MNTVVVESRHAVDENAPMQCGFQVACQASRGHGGMNEAVMVRADDEMTYFEALGMQSYGNGKGRLTFQGAAELFWELFIRPLQS